MLKKIGLPVLLAAMMLALTSCGKEVKIMSYNVRNGRGLDDVRNTERTATVIKNLNPDVVALQELDSMTQRSGTTYVLGELAELTGMTATFSPAIDYDGGKYGVGILSRKEPLSVARYSLPGREEERAMVVAEFEDYYFGCTHLSLTADDSYESAKIICDIARWLQKPFFLAGDFNSYPDSPTVKELEKLFRVISSKDEFTFPADTPNETIDYIIVYEPAGCTVSESSYMVVNEPAASDHRPIVAEVKI